MTNSVLIGLVLLVRRVRIWGGAGKEDPCVSETLLRGGVGLQKHILKLSWFCFHRPSIYFKISNDIKGRCNITCQPVLTIYYV